MNPAASEAWKDAYDVRKNNAVSNNGKSLILVYFVSRAVITPIAEPIANAPLKIAKKFPKALKNAWALNPSPDFRPYVSTDLKLKKEYRKNPKIWTPKILL